MFSSFPHSHTVAMTTVVLSSLSVENGTLALVIMGSTTAGCTIPQAVYALYKHLYDTPLADFELYNRQLSRTLDRCIPPLQREEERQLADIQSRMRRGQQIPQAIEQSQILNRTLALAEMYHFIIFFPKSLSLISCEDAFGGRKKPRSCLHNVPRFPGGVEIFINLSSPEGGDDGGDGHHH